MARVNLVADAKQAATEIQHFFAEGDPGPIPGSLALVPDLMAAALPFMARTLGPSAIAHRTKEVVILRASHKLRCRYCTDTHTAVALGVGLSKNEVAALRGERSIDDAFPSPATQALIAWTDAIADGSAPIPEARLDLLSQHFTQPEVVELTLVATATIMLNRYATALDLPVNPAHVAVLAEHGW